MRRLLALAVTAVLLAACQSGPPGRGLGALFDDEWDKGETAPHAALQSDVVLATWTRGLGAGREVRRALETPEGQVIPESLRQLAEYVLPPTSGWAALRYAELTQLLRVPGIPLPGDPVMPGEDPGGSGTYGPSDTEIWEIPYDPDPRPYGGGFEVQMVLLVPPIKHDMLEFSSPWRLVRVREIVYPDGGIRPTNDKTLTNGDGAAKFARF